jgi:membrane protein required for colicin V production
MISLNIADVAILVLLLFSTFVSIYRGFLREFTTALTWIVSGTLAYIYGPDLGGNLSFVAGDTSKEILGTVIIFMGALIVCYGIKFILFKIFKISGVSKGDRFAGALFGLLRGCILVIAVLLVSTDAIKDQDWYKKSQLLPYFNSTADFIAKITPDSWKKDLKQEVTTVQKQEGTAINKVIQDEVNKQAQQLQQGQQPGQPQPVVKPGNSSSKPN